MCGCGKAVPLSRSTQRGLIEGQPIRWLRGHHKNAPMAGRSHTAEMKARAAAVKRGELNPNWKGDSAGRCALHVWLNTNHPRVGICEGCGHIGKTEYASTTDHAYTRNREDYSELCRRCHTAFDAGIRPKDEQGRWAA